MNKFALSLTLVIGFAALPLFRARAESPEVTSLPKADSINDATLADVAACIRADHAYVFG
jgi:hypothetical protein